MQFEEELARVKPEKDTILTIGVFDGVHLGHKYLISQVVEQARKQNLLSGVITFRRHPQEMLHPRTQPPRLTRLEQRIRLLKDEGVDFVVALTFSKKLAQLTARQFVGLLKKHLRMRGLVIGPDFALGRNREGDIETLRSMGEKLGFSLTVISPIMVNNSVVSSSVIRKALSEGDLEKAHELTGRYFSLTGKVVPGVGRGRSLGFPTANLEIDREQALPTDGIYATWAYIDGKAYPSMTNIGRRPTFDGGERTVEVYILDYKGDLYGKELTIDIVDRLRDEKRFSTVEELKEQIERDIEKGRAILSSRSKN